MPIRLFSQGVSVFGGPLKLNRTATAVSYTALPSDCIIGVTSTAAARTITLPPVATCGPNQFYLIQDESGAANVNNITIAAASGDTILGTATITTAYGRRIVYSNGATKWYSG